MPSAEHLQRPVTNDRTPISRKFRDTPSSDIDGTIDLLETGAPA
jgi:hypothetical protein